MLLCFASECIKRNNIDIYFFQLNSVVSLLQLLIRDAMDLKLYALSNVYIRCTLLTDIDIKQMYLNHPLSLFYLYTIYNIIQLQTFVEVNMSFY